MRWRRVIGTVFVSVVCGCAGSAPVTTLDAMKARQVRALTLSCFQNNPGWRAVYNDPLIISACRQWAESQVR